MRTRLRHLPVGLAAAAAAFLTTAPAHAGVLVSATNCPAETLSQPFLPWGDLAQYTLAPGGNFEGSSAWSLTGGAQTVSGNESFNVGGASDSQSLNLPAGSSATSPSMCVGVQNPDLRLFARNTGDPSSTLTVSVNFQTKWGPFSVPVSWLTASSDWQPSVQVPLLVNLLPLSPNSQTPVSFTFTPQGAGNWQIDDVYVDPFGHCC